VIFKERWKSMKFPVEGKTSGSIRRTVGAMREIELLTWWTTEMIDLLRKTYSNFVVLYLPSKVIGTAETIANIKQAASMVKCILKNPVIVMK
jgi:hypothetical protein